METTTIMIAICGPNLRTKDRKRFHVHAAGCADRRHYGPGRKNGGDDEGWEVVVEGPDVAFGASRAVYDSHITDYGYEYDSPEAVAYWRDNAREFKVFPCTKGAAR